MLSRLGQRVASTSTSTSLVISQRVSNVALSSHRVRLAAKSTSSPISPSVPSVLRLEQRRAVSFLSASPRFAAPFHTRAMSTLTLPKVELCSDLQTSDYDSIVVVTESVESLPFAELKAPLKAVVDLDAKAEKGLFFVPSGLPSKRLIFSGTGPMDGDYDDVRRCDIFLYS